MLKEDKRLWCWVEDEQASAIFDNPQDAIREYLDINHDRDVEVVNLGHPQRYVATINALDIIEQNQQNAYDEFEMCEELAYGYLGKVTDDHIDELEKELNSVLQKWEKRHGYELTAYVVTPTEKYIRKEDGTFERK